MKKEQIIKFYESHGTELGTGEEDLLNYVYLPLRTRTPPVYFGVELDVVPKTGLVSNTYPQKHDYHVSCIIYISLISCCELKLIALEDHLSYLFVDCTSNG
eukprot:sb/3478504/